MIRAIGCSVAIMACVASTVYSSDKSIPLLPAYSDKPFDDVVQKLKKHEQEKQEQYHCLAQFVAAWINHITQEERNALLALDKEADAEFANHPILEGSFYRFLEKPDRALYNDVFKHYRDRFGDVVKSLRTTLHKENAQ